MRKSMNSRTIISLAVLLLQGFAVAGAQDAGQKAPGAVPASPQADHTITATAGAGGSIVPSGAVLVPDGADQAFAITPDPGFYIASVHVDTSSAGAVGSYTFFGVTADHTIDASFSPEFLLNISVTGSGSVVADPDQSSYAPGTNVQLTAIPGDADWYFSHWECDTSGSANPLTLTMNGDRTIGAVFVRYVGQFVPQGGKITGAGAVGTAEQGTSAALSTDGSTAIIGGSQDDGGAGAAWIFTRCGDLWTQQGGKLVGTGASGAARQGQSVALSADGNTAAVGASEDDLARGAVWVYTRTGGVWTQQGPKLVGSGAIGSTRMGHSVALSADGNTLIAGGYLENGGVGAAFVFTRSGGSWTQQGAKLVGTGAVNLSGQGRSVDLSADGNTAVVGGYTDRGYLGAAWVFVRSAGVWSQQGSKLVGTGAVGNSRQGESVSISADGNTIIVGGNTDDGNRGAFWAFTRTAGIWTQQGGKFVGTGEVGVAGQGQSVSLSDDGNKAVIGGGADNGGNGAVWVFTRTGAAWSQQGVKLTGAGAVDPAAQGTVVAVSGDGNTSIVGGPGDDGDAGAAWVYGLGIQTYTITSAAGPHGTISPLGATVVNFGDSLTYSITPDMGYYISAVHADSIPVGSPSSYTFHDVMADHTIEAYFEQSQYTLSVNISGQGSVLTVPDQPTYLSGTGVSLTATPADTTWLFSHWSGDATGSSNPLVFPMDSNTTITAVFVRIPILAAMYRSFMAESLALDTDLKGKLGRYNKRKPSGVEFQCYILNPYAFVDQVTANFKSPIDPNRPFGTIPPSTSYPLNERLHQWVFTFTEPLAYVDTVRFYGFGTKGKLQGVAWHRWSRLDIAGSPIGRESFSEFNILRMPMPNRINVLFETFAVGGFSDDGGLLIGKARPDSARYYGWLLASTYMDVVKTLNYRNIQHTGTPRGLDAYFNGRRLIRRQRKLVASRHNNRLVADLVALKAGVVASAAGITPTGFGELIYDDGGSNPLNGLMVREISALGDSLVMGSYQPGVRSFAPAGVFANLDSTVRKINEAFEGPMDTISFASELVAKGTRELGELTYLKPNPTVAPAVIARTGTAIEEVPGDFALFQNYPNPFNPVTTIGFELPEDSRVTLSIFNMLGQKVETLSRDEEFDSGENELEFDATRLASGVYLYRIDARSIEGSGRSFTRTGKMVLMK